MDHENTNNSGGPKLWCLHLAAAETGEVVVATAAAISKEIKLLTSAQPRNSPFANFLTISKFRE